MTPVLSTVILDPTTAMIGGCALALFSTLLIQQNPETELKRTALLGAIWGGYYGLTVGWMYFNYPDWMLVYLIDAKTISVPGTYALFVAILVLHGYLAALGVGALVLHKKLGAGIAVLVGMIVTNFVIMGLQGHAYAHVGTFAEYHAGTAKELAQVPGAATGMTVAGILAAPPPIIVAVLRLLKGRKAVATGGAPGQARATA